MVRKTRRQRVRLGPGHRAQLRFGRRFFRGPDFGSDIEAMEAAWPRLRDEIMRDHSRRAGCRPWGWWRFEAGLDLPVGTTPSRGIPALLGMTETEYLRQHNLLSKNEQLQLT